MGLKKSDTLFAKRSKCQFNTAELDFLGHVVGADGVKVDPKKTAVVRSWPQPRDIHQLRSFLGLTNFFRRFVQAYANLMGPLTNLLRKSVTFEWSPACQTAFDGIKHALTTAPVLVMLDYFKPFELIADACGFGTGAALLQEGRPIAFLCKQFNAAERNYSVGEQELLAVVHAMRAWRCYLEGVSADMFTVVTDHNPLIYLQTQATLSRRQTRWSEYLQMYTFKWRYRPGKNNVADPLSRKPAVLAAMLLTAGSDELRACAAVKDKDSLQTMTFRWEQSNGNMRVSEPVPHDQKVIASIAALTRSRAPAVVSADSMKSPTQGNMPVSVHEASVGKAAEAPVDLTAFQQQCVAGYAEDPYFRHEENLVDKTLRQGLWWVGDRLMIPDFSDLRETVIQEMHDPPYKGHPGVKKTCKAVERLYWWLTIHDDVQAFVRTCHSCQINKSTTQKPAGLLQPLPIPHRRWGSVSVDLITALPETKKGNTAIVVFCDRLSKMVHIASCRTQINAVEFVELFKHEVFRLHGLPYELVSDRDTRFTSHYMQEVCRLMSIKQSMSTAYHP